METGVTRAAAAAGSYINYGSLSKSSSIVADSRTQDTLNNIYRKEIALREALEEIENNLLLRPEGTKNVLSKIKANRIADLIEEAADALNSLFDDRNINASKKSDVTEYIRNIRSDLKSAISKSFDSESNTLNTNFGITFDFNLSAKKVFDFSSRNRSEMVRKLTSDGYPIKELFYGEKYKDDGLIERILTLIKSAESDLKDILGTKGVLVDTLA